MMGNKTKRNRKMNMKTLKNFEAWLKETLEKEMKVRRKENDRGRD